MNGPDPGPNPNRTGPSLRRRAIEREDATAAGFAIGRARQWPTPNLSNAWREKGLEAQFWRGVDRGFAPRPGPKIVLEQLKLEV